MTNYKVALSFAGENRSYVEDVANELKNKGVSVFYDKYEEIDLWGKNLYDHLNEVYSKKAEYTVIFISRFYKNKLWANHERRSAQEKAFRENKECILPARFDDTEIPGILQTIGYVDLKTKSPIEFTEMICKKINFDYSDIEPEAITKNGLALIDSFPIDNEAITVSDIKKVYLKFNKPIDFSSTKYIVNYYVKTSSFCQWNTCGWIQMEDEDTKISWHIKEHLLENTDKYGPQEVDYHTFEIHIGRNPNEWCLRSKDGDKLPLTKIRVRIKNEHS